MHDSQRERFFLAQTVEMPSSLPSKPGGSGGGAGGAVLFTPAVRRTRAGERGRRPPNAMRPVPRGAPTQTLEQVRRAVDAVTVSAAMARYIRDVLVAVRFHHMTLYGATLRGAEDVLAAVR